MNISYQFTLDHVNWQEVSDVLRRSQLSDHTPDEQKTIFTNSSIVLFVLDDQKIVGVARALSDGICQGAIYNVALDDPYQGYGIGRIMIQKLLDRMKGQNIILYTHPKTVALYEKFGFRRSKTAMCYFDTDPEQLEWLDNTGFFLPQEYRFEDEYDREDMKYTKKVPEI